MKVIPGSVCFGTHPCCLVNLDHHPAPAMLRTCLSLRLQGMQRGLSGFNANRFRAITISLCTDVVMFTMKKPSQMRLCQGKSLLNNLEFSCSKGFATIMGARTVTPLYLHDDRATKQTTGLSYSTFHSANQRLESKRLPVDGQLQADRGFTDL